MKKTLLLLVSAIFALAFASLAMAAVPPLSFHFQAVPSSTRLCNATTSSSSATYVDTASVQAPDIVIRNIGTTVAYYEIGTSPVTATVPTNGTGGSQAIAPGEADLMSKYGADTVACITASGTSTLSITPGTGN